MKKRIVIFSVILVVLSLVGFLSWSLYRGKTELAQAKSEAETTINQATESNLVIQAFGEKYGNAKIIDGYKKEFYLIIRQEKDGKYYASVFIGNGVWGELGEVNITVPTPTP